MPRVPKPADLRDPQLGPAGNAPQIEIKVAQSIGAAGRSMGNAISALGGAFGEVASRVGQAQDATNSANYKLEWLRGDAAIRADLEANAGEDGAAYASAPERYKALNDDLDKRYPIGDPRRREAVTMWREESTFRRGLETAKTYQSKQAGVFLKGFEADVAGVEERIMRGEIDPAELNEYGGALTEKLEGMDRNVIPRSEVERRSREIQGRLAGAFAKALVTPGSKLYDPEAAARFADDLEKGKYEIDGPGYQGPSGADLTKRVSPQEFFGPNVDVNQLPLGMRLSNNPTNIKFTGSNWQRSNFEGLVGPSEAKDQGDPQALFANPLSGMVAGARLAQLKQSQGMDTVGKLIAGPKGWTPGFDAAAKSIADTMGVGVDDKIDLGKPETMQKFMRALIRQEHGKAGDLYTDDLIKQGVEAASRTQGPNGSRSLAIAPQLIGKPAAEVSRATYGTTPGVVHAVTDQTSRTFTKQGFGERTTGAITVNGRTYQFVNGGSKRGSIPLGEYQIGRFTPGDLRAREGRSYRRDAFELSDVDGDAPATKGTKRTGLLIHDGNNGVTAGCVGIIGDFEQFKKDLLAEQQKNGGKLALNLTPRPTKADAPSSTPSNDNTPSSQVAGYQSVLPSGAQAEFGRLMEAAQKNPDQPLREVIDANLAARIAEDQPDIDIDNMTVGQAVEQLQGMSVGDAQGALGEAGLTTEQALGMFAEGAPGSAPSQPGQGTEPSGMRVPRLTGRLQQGQTFTIKTPRGEFSLSSEQLNAMPSEARKAYADMAREQAKLVAVKRDRQANEMMRQQIANLEEFGTDAPGFDMKMLEGHFAKTKSEEFPKFVRQVERLRALNAAFEGHGNYDLEMLQERVDKLKPQSGDPDVAGSKEIYDKAQAKLDGIIKQRETDPASSVEGSAMVASVRESFANGRPTNPAQNLQLVDARLRAQADVGIGEQNRKPLTTGEARVLAEKIRGLDEGKAYDALQTLSDDVRKKYGERYSGLIIDQVVRTAIRDQTKRETFVSVMRGLDEEGKISGTSIERIRELDELNAMSKATKAPEAAAAPSRSIGQRLYDNTIGMVPPEVSGIVGPFNPRAWTGEPQAPKVPRRNPPSQAVEALKRDPSKAADFEAKYGLQRGESRKFLIE